MTKAIFAAGLAAFLMAGCVSAPGALKDVGDAMQESGELGVTGSKYYLCNLARVGPLRESFDTQQEALAYHMLCGLTPGAFKPEPANDGA